MADGTISMASVLATGAQILPAQPARTTSGVSTSTSRTNVHTVVDDREPDSEGIELHTIEDSKHDSTASSGIQALAISIQNNTARSLLVSGDVEGAHNFLGSVTPNCGEGDTASAAPTRSAAQLKAVQRRKRIIHLATLCFDVFLNGWNDGTAGPLLPRIQAHYGIGFAIVSLIFVSSTIGFITGAFANVYLTDKYGFGKLIVTGSILQCLAYAVVAPAGPFPLMCVAYSVVGVGLSLQNAHYNAFVASSKDNAPTKIGILLAAYGLGALFAPLVSTHFSQQEHWSYYFIISAGMYALNSALLWIVFRGRRQEEIKAEADDLSPQQEVVQSNKYKQIFKIREVHILSLFALLYVGVEVTIGGWTVSYVQETRNGTSDAGYISSGFFAGMTLGRIVLMWLNEKIGERHALFIYALLAIVLEVTVWVVPSFIENGVAVAFVGLLLGPMYPILVHHSTHILPRWLLTGCMGYISSIGQTGSAILPFLTGLLASKFGIASLQPFIVSMMSVMIIVWALVPRVRHVPI